MERKQDVFRTMGVGPVFPRPFYKGPTTADTSAEDLMGEHTRITIQFVASTFYGLAQGTGMSRREQDRWRASSAYLGGKLVGQIDDWHDRLIRVAVTAGSDTYDASTAEDAFESFKKHVTRHIQAAGELAKAVYTGDEQGAEMAAEFLLGKNTLKIGNLLASITACDARVFVKLWRDHVACTATYIKAALMSKDEFLREASDCLETSMRVGQEIDTELQRADFRGYGHWDYGHRSFIGRDKNPSEILETLHGWITTSPLPSKEEES